MRHIPSTQFGVADGQTRPQLPQLSGSEVVSTSHPLLGSWSQSACSLSHVSTHVPPVQVADVVPADEHTMPQPPQWSVLTAVSTQPLSQHSTVRPTQTLPQLPQF